MTITLQQAQRELDRADIALRRAEATLAERKRDLTDPLRELREAETYAGRAGDDPETYARRYAQVAAPRAAVDRAQRALDEAESELRATQQAAIEPRRAALCAYLANLDLLAERYDMLASEVKPAITVLRKFHSEMGLLLHDADRAKRMISELSKHVRVESTPRAISYAESESRARQLLNAVPLQLSAITDRKLRDEASGVEA